NTMFLNRLWKVARVPLFLLLVLAITLRPGRLSAQADDVADVPSQELRAGKDEKKRFFLIGPREGARSPRQGFGLVVTLPGGPGSADFPPFVKRIFKYAIPDGYLVAQPVAVKWTDEQGVVWPTEKDAVAKKKFSTEKFVAEVIKEVKHKHKV